jgi:excinuclease ABC subunit B
VSAIYGLGDPAEYRDLMVTIAVGEERSRDTILEELVRIQYSRHDAAFERGTFRVRGDTVEIFPAYEEQAVRIELWGDTVERISKVDALTGKAITQLERCAIYPATHFVVRRSAVERAVAAIRIELQERLAELRATGKLLEAQRLETRTHFDIDMLLEAGTCAGVENYSRHFSGRQVGERPACLLDYFPADFLTILDESHVTLPQLGGMFEGDRSRKLTLVEHGFRLPSALDNRPLNDAEFMDIVPEIIFVSATPGNREVDLTPGNVTEQIRSAGLGERVLVTTLTKRMAEDLTDYLQQTGVRVRYMHSDIDVIERMEIVRGLRLGDFDVLVGINLLREGLDLPEVGLVAILDADQEGFLRSDRSLIQTVGRAARHAQGRAIMYADRITGSMERALAEMDRRRGLQQAHNERHGVTPVSIRKSVEEVRFVTRVADARTDVTSPDEADAPVPPLDRESLLEVLEQQMREAAAELDFEVAARLRDQIFELRAAGDPVRRTPKGTPPAAVRTAPTAEQT